MMKDYVHGYSKKESERLEDQADTLSAILHYDTQFPPGSNILEAGCGVGAQTIILAKNSPEAQITSIDISEESLITAKNLIDKEGIKNVQFKQADIMDLPFGKESFDHIFVCFVLEHVLDPVMALKELKKYLKKGGSITVIEGDHGSCYFHPESNESLMAWECLIKAQQDLGGDPLIGRRIFPLLEEAGFKEVAVTPRVVYVDRSKPEMVDGFIKKTIIAMVEGVKDQAINSGLIDHGKWEKGIDDLYKSAQKDGTFFYNFFKGSGIK
jgi:SAM-dependent methyltransferase